MTRILHKPKPCKGNHNSNHFPGCGKEVWVDIKDFVGFYQISNLGNLRSLDRRIKCGYGKTRLIKGSIIKKHLDKTGYEITLLAREGKKVNAKIHRLVAEAFIPNPKNKPQVNHINEIKSDNRSANLEWATSKENNNHNGLPRRMGLKRKNGKLSKKVFQYSIDMALIKVWPSAREAQRNGFMAHSISLCCHNKQKTHLGYKWSYERL